MKKIAKYLILILVLLIIGAGIGLWLLLKNLDSSSLKKRVQEEVRSALGIRVAYEHLSLNIFGNLKATGIKIFSPEAYKDIEPVLFSVDSLEVEWALLPLLKGLLHIESIKIKGVKVSLVVNEDGKNSLDALLAGLPKGEKEEKVESKLSDGLPIKDLHVRVASLSIEDVAFTKKTMKAGKVHSTMDVRGLCLSGSLFSYKRDASLSLRIASQEPDGLRFSLEDPDGTKEAVVALLLSLDAQDPLRVSTNLSLKVVRQDLLGVLQKGLDCLDLGLNISFLPDEQKTFVSLSKMSMFEGAIKASLEARISDDLLPVSIDKASLSVDGEKIPKEVLSMFKIKLDGFSVQGEVEKVLLSSMPEVQGKVRLVLKGNEVALEDLLVAKDLGLEVTFRNDNELHLDMGAEEIASQRGIKIKGATTSLRIKDLRMEDALKGHISFGGDALMTMRGVELSQPGMNVGFQDLKLSLNGNVLGREANIALSFDNASIVTRKAILIPASSLSASLKAISLDMSEPLRSSASAHILGHVGHIKIEGSIKKEGEIVHNDIVVVVQGLGFIRDLFADAVKGFDLCDENLECLVKVGGHAKVQSNITLFEKATIEIKNLSMQLKKKPFRINDILLATDLSGKLDALRVQASMAMTNIWFAGEKTFDSVKVLAETTMGAPYPPLGFQMDAHGRILSLNLSSALKQGFRNLSFSLDTKIEDMKKIFQLARLAIEGIDPEKLAGSFHVEGDVLADVPLMLALGKGIEDLRGNVLARLAIDKATYETKALSVSLKDASAKVKVALDQDDITLEIDAKPGELKGDTRQNTFSLEDAHLEMKARAKKRFEESDADMSISVQAGKMEQDILPLYPVGNVTLSLKARMEKLDRFLLEEMTFKNQDGGTTLVLGARAEEVARSALRGLQDKVIGRKGLLFEGVLEQELSKLKTGSFGMVADGKIRMPFLLQSGDRRVYRISTDVMAQSVSLTIPKTLKVSNLSGRIPMLEEVVLRDGKPTLVLQDEPNLYSVVRFFDQQPFLPSRGFFVCDNLQVAQVSLGALAGNMEVNKNMVTIDQLEAGWHGGKISGQVILDILPSAPRLLFRGRVTGIYAKSGARFDANAALDFAIRSLELDGRIHLVRIGRENLLELLDAFDPYKEDVAMNRVRLALKLAYPKTLVLKAEGGYMSGKVELGGLGSMVRIDEIRGVKVTPLLRRFLGSFVEGGAL
jgi:hypothetical protein